ncbi:MAG: delta-60 repeat domain-containing protein [Actinomycetota bacterium]
MDPTFSGDGKAFVNIQIAGDPLTASADQGQGVAIQSDGKIVVAGTTRLGLSADFAVARFTSAGALDTTWDGDGKLITDFATSPDFARAVTIRQDRRGGEQRIPVVRLRLGPAQPERHARRELQRRREGDYGPRL